ncbi:unnamed protein product, partial [marine sediment metagenome]
EDVAGIIAATAKDIPPEGYDDSTGAGRINAYDALRYFEYPSSIRYYPISAIYHFNVGTYPLMLIGIEGLPDDQYRVEIHEVHSGDFSLPADILEFLGIWGLGRLTTGYSFDYEHVPKYGQGYCTVEERPGNKYRAKTFVFYVMELDDWTPIGWFPCHPNNVQFRYSVFSVNVVRPYNLRATDITETSLTLRWNHDYIDLIDGYTVKRDGQVIGNLPSSQLYWDDSGLEPGHTYHYEVLARKDDIYSAPAHLDVSTLPQYMIAQSKYPKMSASVGT